MRKLLLIVVSFSAFLMGCSTVTPEYMAMVREKGDMVQEKRELVMRNPEVRALSCDRINDWTTPGRLEVEPNFKFKHDLFKKNKIFNNSKLDCSLGVDIKDNYAITFTYREVATFDNNVYVSVEHTNGKGWVGINGRDKASWLISCDRNAMTDKLICSMIQGDLGVLRDSYGYSIAVGNNHYPKTKSHLRIGSSKPYSSEEGALFSDKDSKLIMKGLLSSESEKIMVSYRKWPNEYDTSSEIYLENFKLAKQALDTIYGNFK